MMRPREPQVLHGGLAIDHAAAGGDDLVLAVQGEDEAFFRGPHAQVAFLVHDLLQGAAFPGLEEEIGIQKAEMGVFGHQHADGALAGAGHADEDEVGGGGQCYGAMGWRCQILDERNFLEFATGFIR